MSTNFNGDLVDEINTLRTNPKRYAVKVLLYKKYFKGDVLRIPGTNAGIKTEEGPAAYTEAGEFLENQARIEPLLPSKGLCKIAEELLKQIQECDPSDLNSIDMEGIIANFGTFSGNFSRAVDFGGETPEQVLVNLLVSDGDPSRGQRESLLSTDLKRVGVATGTHPTYRHCSVIVSCTKFENTKDKDDKEDFGRGEKKVEAPPKKETNSVKSSKKIVTKNDSDDEKEEPLPPGCVSINKNEKIVVENGMKKKVLKITRVMEDGSKEYETIKETMED